jgi:hypothetical protein
MLHCIGWIRAIDALRGTVCDLELPKSYSTSASPVTGKWVDLAEPTAHLAIYLALKELPPA